MRVGDIEVQGLSDGILKTSLDLVIGKPLPAAKIAARVGCRMTKFSVTFFVTKDHDGGCWMGRPRGPRERSYRAPDPARPQLK